MAATRDQFEPSKLIAIVEDDQVLAQLFQDVLEDIGSWKTVVFCDGVEALQRLPQVHADLILLDVNLPSLDGVSLYRILRGHTATRTTPVLFITASRDWELQRQGIGSEQHLHKPFDVNNLLQMVRRLLGNEASSS